MDLVVDTNILFSYFKNGSYVNGLIKSRLFGLFSPDFALVELYKYKNELLEKSGMADFDKLISLLKEKVVFVDISEYKRYLKDLHISDAKDEAYIALLLKLRVPVWSNDRDFKRQKIVDVFTAEELVSLFDKA